MTGETPKRLCACPCKEPLDGMRPSARYRTPACKTRHYRERQAETPRVTSRSGPSGRQVSYRRALEATARAIVAGREAQSVSVTVLAARFMGEALPERQRKRLNERRAA